MSNTVLAFVIIIGGYVLGIWVGAFIVGLRDRFSSPDVTMDDCDWILCAIWPISLVLWMIMVFCDFIVWVGHFIPKKELLKKTV